MYKPFGKDLFWNCGKFWLQGRRNSLYGMLYHRDKKEEKKDEKNKKKIEKMQKEEKEEREGERENIFL